MSLFLLFLNLKIFGGKYSPFFKSSPVLLRHYSFTCGLDKSRMKVFVRELKSILLGFMWQTNKVRHKTVKWKKCIMFKFLKSVMCISVNLDSDTRKENLMKLSLMIKITFDPFPTKPVPLLTCGGAASRTTEGNNTKRHCRRHWEQLLSSWNGNKNVEVSDFSGWMPRTRSHFSC